MGLKDWYTQDVSELPKTGYRLNDGFNASGDFRVKPPQGEISEAIINLATNPAKDVVPVTVVFDIVEMIKAYYVTPSLGRGALEAIWALFFKMYSKDQRRIAHCLVVLDILMKNCGIVFVNNVALYMHLLRNFFDRGDFDERNTLLATGMIAGWQTMQIDMSVELQNKALDPISKLEQMFNALVRANYPFPEGAFDKIPAARMEKLKADGNKLKFSMLRTEVTVIGNGRELHLREHGTKPLFSLQSLVPK